MEKIWKKEDVFSWSPLRRRAALSGRNETKHCNPQQWEEQLKKKKKKHFSNSPYTSRFQNILFFFHRKFLHFHQPLAAVHMLPHLNTEYLILHTSKRSKKKRNGKTLEKSYLS